MNQYLIAVTPNFKGLVQALVVIVTLDLSDLPRAFEYLVIKPDDVVTRLLSPFSTCSFLPRCESLRWLDILWSVTSAQHFPKAFRAIASLPLQH